MGLFDRFRDFGVQRPIPQQPAEPSADDQAIARYRYMLRTAPPETIEQAHAEAFAKLTPEQRRRVLEDLTNEIPEAERAAAARAGDSPEQLARTATRAEIREPGIMERVFGGRAAAPAAGGAGMGGLFAGSFFASMAGTVLGSMIAQHFFSNHPEASHLFGDTPAHSFDHDGATPDAGAASSDSFDTAGDAGIGEDFGSGFDGFDV